MFKKIILFFSITIALYGCSMEETLEKGQDLVQKSEEVIDKVDEASSKVNVVTSMFDGNIREVQNSNVYEEDFTFKELIDGTIKNPKWKSESNTYVTVQGELKPTKVDLGEFNGVEEIIIGFPFDKSSGISLANAGVFTTIDGEVIVDGTSYEVSGQGIIDILATIYKAN